MSRSISGVSLTVGLPHAYDDFCSYYVHLLLRKIHVSTPFTAEYSCAKDLHCTRHLFPLFPDHVLDLNEIQINDQ